MEMASIHKLAQTRQDLDLHHNVSNYYGDRYRFP